MRLIVAGNLLFLLAALCWFTASTSLAIGLGIVGLVLEIGGVLQLVNARQREQDN